MQAKYDNMQKVMKTTNKTISYHNRHVMTYNYPLWVNGVIK